MGPYMQLHTSTSCQFIPRILFLRFPLFTGRVQDEQWPNQFPFNSTAKTAPRMHQNSPFKLKNRKILWGWGTAHSPDLSSVGRETPLPTLYPLGGFGASILAPTTLDTRAFGARTQIFNRNRRHCIMSENLSHHLLQKGLGLGCQRLADHITDLQSCYASRLLQLDAAKTQLHLVWISSCSLRGLRQSLPDDRTLTIIDVLQPTDVRATSVCYWTAS